MWNFPLFFSPSFFVCLFSYLLFVILFILLLLSYIIGGTSKEGGFPILRGTDVFIALYNIHRSEEFWENPNEFNPDRFLKEFHLVHFDHNQN